MNSEPVSPIWIKPDLAPDNEWVNRSGDTTPRQIKTPPLEESDIGGGFNE